jgi:hypothetical protein
MEKTKKNIQSKLKTNALQNLLQEIVVSDSEPDSSRLEEMDSPRQIMVKPTRINRLEEDGASCEAKESLAISKIEELLSLLNLSDPGQLLPTLSKMKSQAEEYELADTISRSLQVFLYNIGKGKIAKRELVQSLEDLEHAYSRNMEAVDLLDEICIEVGAKREKLAERVQELLQVKADYF